MNIFRQDIQGLRALAVIAVITYHFFPRFLPGGYLGVDVFFVISGFLITGLIAQRIESGSFTLARFWLARARRILPAAFVTIIVTVLVSLPILSGREQTDLAGQAVASLLFFTNFYFLGSGSYFAPNSDFAPLLHMWSLAVEEQFYLVIPLMLRAMPRRWWLPVLAAITAASMIACFRHTGLFSPTATFYLPFTRAWQLGLGAVATLVMRGRPLPPAAVQQLAWPALALLLGMLWFQLEGLDPVRDFRPGPSALVACLATTALLSLRNQLIEQSRAIAVLEPIGNLSFSLYLVHWPVLALYRNSIATGNFGSLPAVALAVLIVLLAVVLQRWVERPLHRPSGAVGVISPRRLIGGLAGAALAVLGLAAISDGLGQRSAAGPLARRGDYRGFGPACNQRARYEADPRCRNSPQPELMIWGDSIAMAAVPGLAATPGSRIVQVTSALCGPLLDRAPLREGIFDRQWAKGCIALNNSVIAALARMPGLRTVVLSSSFDQYLRPEDRLALADGSIVATGLAGTVQSLTATVAALRAAGKRVVILARPPAADFDVGMCIERAAAGRLLLRRNGCQIAYAGADGSNLRVRQLLLVAAQRANVAVINFDGLLCRTGMCDPVSDGVPLYFDNIHLSAAGSRLLAQRLNLMARLEREAR